MLSKNFKHLIKNVLYGQSKNTLSFCFVKIGSNAACGSGSDSAGEKNPPKKQKKKKKKKFLRFWAFNKCTLHSDDFLQNENS